MKVLFVTPYPPKIDGIAVHTQRLISALHDNRAEHLDVEVMTTRLPAGPPDEVGVHRVLSASPMSIFRATRVIRTLQPDVVHFQYALPAQGVAVLYAFIAAAVARRQSRVRVVITCHEVRRELLVLRWLGACIFAGLGAGADRVVVHTEESRSLLIHRCRVPASKVVVTPLGAERWTTSSPEVLAETLGRYSDPGRALVVFFGWIHPDKGIEDLIEATALVKEHDEIFEKLDVLICGSVRPRVGLFKHFGKKDVAYEAALHAAVRRLGLRDVVSFKGFVPDVDVMDLLTQARIVVLPYRDTTQSAVLGQAVAAGTPLIATDLPGLRETVEQGGGILTSPRDPNELAAAMVAVLGDNELEEALRTRQAQLMHHISFACVCETLLALYSDICSKAGASC